MRLTYLSPSTSNIFKYIRTLPHSLTKICAPKDTVLSNSPFTCFLHNRALGCPHRFASSDSVMMVQYQRRTQGHNFNSNASTGSKISGPMVISNKDATNHFVSPAFGLQVWIFLYVKGTQKDKRCYGFRRSKEFKKYNLLSKTWLLTTNCTRVSPPSMVTTQLIAILQ